MKKKVQKLSPFRTFFTLFKGFVCTGILYLPNAMLSGGWFFSIFALFLSYFLTTICLYKLLQCKILMPNASFTDLGVAALGKGGKIIVDIELFLTQVGCVIAYVYFISSQLQEVFIEAFGLSYDFIYFGILDILNHLCFIFR